jgi:hypothetical protein
MCRRVPEYNAAKRWNKVFPQFIINAVDPAVQAKN